MTGTIRTGRNDFQRRLSERGRKKSSHFIAGAKEEERRRQMKLHIASSNRLIIGTSTESSGRYCIVTTQRDLINANCFAGMQPFKSCATAAEADGLHRCPRGKEERSFLNGRSSAILFIFFFFGRPRLRFWVTCMRERRTESE